MVDDRRLEVNVPRFRTTLALVIAPSAPALLFTFFVILAAGLRGIVLGFYMVLLSALIGYRITLFAGLQLYLLRRWPRWIGWGTYVAGGAALGAGAAAVAGSNLLGVNPGRGGDAVGRVLAPGCRRRLRRFCPGVLLAHCQTRPWPADRM
jgi:hypothetical protein